MKHFSVFWLDRMSENYLYTIVFLIGAIGVCSAFLVIKIAKERDLDLKRWIFYAIYFHVFALIYLLLIKTSGNHPNHK